MKILSPLFITAFVILLGGCGIMTEGVEDATPESKEIIFATKGAMYGGGTEGFEEGGKAIYSEDDWNTLKSEMSSVNPVSEEIHNAIIDFQTEMVIVYIDKVEPSGGYAVIIDEVFETEKEIVAVGKKISPKEEATSVLTQPYFILSTSKSEKPVRFELTQQ